METGASSGDPEPTVRSLRSGRGLALFALLGATALGSCRLGDLLSPSSTDPVNLLVEPPSVSDSVVGGNGDVRTVRLTVTPEGSDSTTWTASSVRDSPWLVVVPTRGPAPGSIALELRSGGLDPGRYDDTVVVAVDGGDDDGAVRVPVTLQVEEPPAPPRAPSALAQLHADGTTTIPTGGTTDGTTVVLRATVADDDAADQVKLEVEVRPLGTDFSGPTASSGLVDNGSTASVTVSGLARGTGYHWRARAVDGTGLAGPWASFGGNAESQADFTITGPTPPPDEPEPPASPAEPAQLRSDGSTPIAVGATTDETRVVLRARVSDPDPGARVKLEVEVRPVGTGFNGPTASSGHVESGSTASVAVSGLAEGTAYHWRARAVDDDGLAGPWRSFGGNAETATDFAVAETPPPDVPEPPAAPSAPGQFRSDGSTAIPTGGSTDETTVVLRARLSDPDEGDRVRLEVEVRPVGIPFTGVVSARSGERANGDTASVVIEGLTRAVSYHWQARALDDTGRAGPWISFGGNGEAATDFRVEALPDPPSAPTELAQLRSDGSTAIATGGTTDETTVVLRARLSDPDEGERVKLEVEVRPLGTGFSGPTASSGLVDNGSTASVTVSGLATGTSYHWRARTVDETGRASAWASFGGNAESAADFSVADPADPPSAPAGLAQLRSDGSTAIPTGGTTDETTVVLRAALSDPDEGDRVRLEVEVRPLGTGFSGPTESSVLVDNGSTASVTASGLATGSSYHWRARTVDETGRDGPWVAYGGNAEGAADFSVADPADPPSAPAGLAQLRSDGSTAIPTGGTTDETTVVLRAALSDPDEGDRVRLEVEVRPLGTGFTGPTASSELVDNGSTASVTVSGLATGTSYHWRARAVDDTGRDGPWVSFGGNAESAADFTVAEPPPPDEPDPPAAPTGLAQLRSDGSTAIPTGGTTEERTVVFRAEVSDPDSADRLKLEVEVRPVATGFSGTTASSDHVENGSTASVTVSGLDDDTSFHWRARTIDDTGLEGAWVAYGDNAESAADFTTSSPSG